MPLITRRLSRRLRAIVFDYDGTLAEHADNANRLLTIIGAYANASVSLEAIHGATSDFQLVDAFVSKAQRENATSQILAANLEFALRPRRLAGLVPVLKTLASDFKLFVYSGRDQGSLDAAMRRQHLRHWFVEIVGADAETPAKPHPGPLLSLLRRHRIHSTQAVYIGDSPADRDLAAAARCGHVVAGWFRHARRDPRALGYARSISDLKLLLRPLT